MFPKQIPPSVGRRNNDFSLPLPPLPSPAATAAPTKEKALNSPLDKEDDTACNEGADEPPEDGMEPEGEGVRSSQGSVDTAKVGLLIIGLENDDMAKGERRKRKRRESPLKSERK